MHNSHVIVLRKHLKGTLQIVSKADSILWGNSSLKMYAAHVLMPVFVICDYAVEHYSHPRPFCVLREVFYGHILPNNRNTLNLSSTTAWMNLLRSHWNTHEQMRDQECDVPILKSRGWEGNSLDSAAQSRGQNVHESIQILKAGNPNTGHG